MTKTFHRFTESYVISYCGYTYPFALRTEQQNINNVSQVGSSRFPPPLVNMDECTEKTGKQARGRRKLLSHPSCLRESLLMRVEVDDLSSIHPPWCCWDARPQWHSVALHKQYNLDTRAAGMLMFGKSCRSTVRERGVLIKSLGGRDLHHEKSLHVTLMPCPWTYIMAAKEKYQVRLAVKIFFDS